MEQDDSKTLRRRKTHWWKKIAITTTILTTKKKKKSQLMNKVMNKKTMSMSNTQLTLFVVQCILKVDARGSKKSHESFQKKKTT
jgi:hypothetical protein